MISDALLLDRLWYSGPNEIRYAKFHSRLRDAVICVYEVPGNVIERYEQAAEFRQQ